MSSTTSDPRLIDAEANLSEPHFDQEATLLAARPVVPLEEVRAFGARTGLARPWVLGLGLASALLIGVLATVIYYSQSGGENLSVFEGIEVASGAEGFSSEAANSFSGPAPTQPQIEAEKPSTPNIKAPVDTGTAKANAAEPAKKARPRLVDVIREQKSNHAEDQIEERRADRRQARRERRRTQRERRDGKPDDVLRIRDIFEGSPRP